MRVEHCSTRSVVLSGLLVDHGGGQWDFGALRVENCDGPVRVQECTLFGYDGLPGEHDEGTYPEEATAGGYLRDGKDVVFSACELRGGNGGGELDELQGGSLPNGAPGIDSDETALAVFRTLLSGDGGEDFSATACGGSGGAGIYFFQSSLYAVHSVFRGGNGQDGWDFIPCCGDGGDGAYLVNAEATEFTSSFYGGTAGCWIFDDAGECKCTDGQPIVGTIDSQSGQGRAALMPRLAREGETYTIDYYGRAGDLVLQMQSSSTEAVYRKAWRGVLVIPRPIVLSMVGTIPASGVLSIPHVEGSLPPSVEGRLIHRQTLFRSPPGGAAFLSNPSALVVLDSSF